MLARTRGLDGGIQGQQVGLVGDVVNDGDLGGDLLHGVGRLAHDLAALPWLRQRLGAMRSVTLALSAFCLTLEAISCSEAVVSSTLAACWEAECDSD